MKLTKIGRRLPVLCLALVFLAFISLAEGNARGDIIKVDPKLPKYKRTGLVTGNLDSIGSDTLNNLMTLWSEGFRRVHSNIIIQVEGKGSSTAPPALLAGTAKLGPMSRKMKGIELEVLEKKYGFKPTAVGVALDALAIYVNKDNPVASLTLQEVDAIFSRNRKGGYGKDIITWDQLGLKDRYKGLPISLFGRNSASGTYGFFKKKALFKGDFKNTVKEQPGSASVVMGVTEDSLGIGYSGIGYITSGVRAVPLVKKKDGKAYLPTYKNMISGKYPLGRMLYIYIVKKPKTPLDPLIREFLTYVLSADGQKVVIKDGYLPLPAKIAAKQLALIK